VIGRYPRFLGMAVAIVIGLCAVGWLPTERLAGPRARARVVAGCTISLLSAGFAGYLLVAVQADTAQVRMRRGFQAMMVRLVVALVLGIAAALSGEFATSPLLFWLAMAYIALLPLEVKLAIQ